MHSKKDPKTKSNDTNGMRRTQNDPRKLFDRFLKELATKEETENASNEDTQDEPMPDWDKVTHSEYSNEFIELYYSKQRLAGQLIDPKNADCVIDRVQILDPYGLYYDLGPFQEIGNLLFARDPDIGIWVVDNDIPKEIRAELRKIHSQGPENSTSAEYSGMEDDVSASEIASQHANDRDEWRTRIHSQWSFRHQLIELFDISRKLGGMVLDPASAETCTRYVPASDPYELHFDPHGRTAKIGWERFARMPFDDFWIHEADIPESIRNALWSSDEDR